MGLKIREVYFCYTQLAAKSDRIKNPHKKPTYQIILKNQMKSQANIIR
jgi:hypothetical protein